MKSARERADKLAESFGFVRNGLAWKSFCDEAEREMREHARDQRQTAAETVRVRLRFEYAGSIVNEHALANKAHGYVVNAPAPGE